MQHHETPTLAPVCRGGKWGFIDARSELVIPFGFDDALTFSCGHAAVNLGGERRGRAGYLDRKGRVVIPAEYKEAVDAEG